MKIILVIYNFLERNVFNTLTKKIAGNFVPLLIMQALALGSFYLYVRKSGGDAGVYLAFGTGVLLVSLVITGFNVFFLRFLIIRPLNNAREFLDGLSGSLGLELGSKRLKTDLSSRIPVSTIDEIGELFKSYNTLFDRMNQVFEKLQGIANTIFRIMITLTDNSNDTFRNAGEQSIQSASIATSAEEMSQTIMDMAQNAASASEKSVGAGSAAEEGQGVADGAVEYISRMHQSTVELSSIIENLKARALEIGEIVTVINDIADQTNLLALNAAIEAARAGEQGRGFAVVADEVRKLAERTIKATTEISGMVSSIQEETVRTTESMEKTKDDSRKVFDLVDQVGSSLSSITSAVNTVKGQITHIATAVEEQSVTAEEVAGNAERSSALAKRTESLSSGMLESISGLRKSSILLNRLTRDIKTTGHKSIGLEMAITDSLTTLSRFRAHMQGISKMDVSRIDDPSSSKLGKWVFEEGREHFGHMSGYGKVESLVREFHKLAASTLKASESGDSPESMRMLDEMERKVETIVENMEGLKG
jgi:methyl-accepting chemotaxis protein